MDALVSFGEETVTARSLALASAVALATACGARFVEPTPPLLAREQVVLSSGQRTEPVVAGAVIDLQIPDPALCAATRARLLSAVRAAIGTEGAELAERDLAPGCAQVPGRVLPVADVEADLAAIAAAFPGAVIRPVLVYANDVDLAVPPSVAWGLDTLRADARARGEREPIVWGLVLATAARSYAFDATIPWSHATDEAMWAALASRFDTDLPLQTRAALSASVPLSDPSRASLLKICAVSGAAISGCALDGSACPVADGTPRASATWAPVTAELRSRFAVGTASVQFESCAGRCDRYVDDADGDLLRWDSTTGCLAERG